MSANKTQSEYLVRGALLKCDKGSHPRRLNLPVSHGVYTLGHPMIRIDDNVAGVNISYFGVCNSGTPPKGAKEIRLAGYVPEGETASAPDVQGYKCMPDILCEWKCVNEQACITGDFAAVTTDSYLVCACGGLIEPLTSGQEYQERCNLVNGTLSVGSENGVLLGKTVGNVNNTGTGKNTNTKKDIDYYKKAQFYKDYYGPKLSEYEKKVKFYKDLYTPKKDNKIDDKGTSKTYAMSSQGINLLKAIELPESYDWLMEKDKDGNITGIYPYYVGDRGITIGYGHCIRYDEVKGKNKSQSELDLLKELGLSDTAVDVKHNKLPYKVPGSKAIPIKRINEILDDDFSIHVKDLNDYLSKEKITVTQNEFDALVVYRFLNGRLGSKITQLLESGNRNTEDWYSAIVGGTQGDSQYSSGWREREKSIYNVFTSGIYSYQGVEVKK